MRGTVNNVLSEYYEIIYNTLQKSYTPKRQITYAEELNSKVNAYAKVLDCQRNTFEIRIFRGLIDSLYKGIMTENRLSKIVKRIKNDYSVTEDSENINRIFLITSALICFFHEFGHIFNGHLLNYNKNHSVLLLEERTSSNSSSSIPAHERNMLEFDADSLAGICIGPLTEFIIIDCKERKRELYKELVVISALYLFNELNVHVSDDDEIYPPIAIRIFTVTNSFLVCNDYYLKTGKLPENDIEINDKTLSKYNIDEIIKEVNNCLEPYTHKKIDYSKEKIEKWWNIYNENRHVLVKIHEYAKKHFT